MSNSSNMQDTKKIIDNLENKDGYQYLIDHFKEERIVKRINSLGKRALCFINSKNLNGVVGLNKEILMIMVIDYFADIYRLKMFHDDIQRVNLHKIYSYTAYWWLKRKPLQVINNTLDKEELVYINEEFMAQYLFFEMVKMSKAEKYSGLVEIDKDSDVAKEYLKTLNYFLRYRIKNANSVELALETFEFSLKLFKSKENKK